MAGYNLVAVYGARADAERARDRLMQFGIPGGDIQINAPDMVAGSTLPPGSTTAETGAAGPMPAVRRESFWDRLFGRDLPETHRDWYETSLREGRTMLSVFVRDEAQRPYIEDILDEFSPLAFEQESATAMAASQTGMAETSPLSAPVGDRLEETTLRPGAIADDRARLEQGSEEVIPVVKEELAVGKRASERRYRIHTYVVETPVENEVTLRDERVIVERRPVAGERTLGPGELPQERDYEIVERHEEPVVEKRVRNVEDVVVRKEADERTERVRDTVRETRVEVENEAAAPVPGQPLPQERKP